MNKVIILLVLFISLNATEYRVGFSQDSSFNKWKAIQKQQVIDAFKKHTNIQLIVKDAEGKIAKQVRDIENFIKDSVDVIITSPKDSKVLSLVLKKAIAKGIKVVLISRTIDSNDYTSFVAPDNYLIGANAAEVLIKKMKSKGTVLMLQGVKGSSTAKEREKGFESISKKYSNIKIIKKRANYLSNDAIKVMEDIYSKNIKFDAIYSHSDSMLIGAREVMKKFKKDTASIPSVSIDYVKETREAIRNGEQFASFLYPTSAKEGVALVVDILEGKTVPKNVVIDTKLITKQNVNKVDPLF